MPPSGLGRGGEGGVWNGIYATDVHCLLARLPNPTTRGADGKRSPGLGFWGILENPGPAPPQASLPASSRCNRANKQRGSCSDTRFSQGGYPLETLLNTYMASPSSGLHAAQLSARCWPRGISSPSGPATTSVLLPDPGEVSWGARGQKPQAH